MTKLVSKNEYFIKAIEGKDCVVFVTGGKYKVNVIVDIQTWNKYLYKYHWTAVNKQNYTVVKTSVNKHSKSLHRMIVENEYSELDYWGNTIDHINNNPLDNRISNLRIYNSKLNATNIKSKFYESGLHLIHENSYTKSNGEKSIYGYKIHTNVFDETIYKNFKTVEEAIDYRDTVVIPYIEQRVNDLKKKTRDIEFERGLRDKLENDELEEIVEVLKRYDIQKFLK